MLCQIVLGWPLVRGTVQTILYTVSYSLLDIGVAIWDILYKNVCEKKYEHAWRPKFLASRYVYKDLKNQVKKI